MYFSTHRFVPLPTEFDGGEFVLEDGDIHLHLPDLYLAFSPEEWDTLVTKVSQARGLVVEEHPFSGATIVTLPTPKEDA